MIHDDTAARAQRFAELLCELHAELDWPRLGRAYCHEGGESFFDAPAIERLRDSGLRLASDVVEALDRLRARGPSVYVGAGAFELAPIVAERVLLGRDVDVFALPGEEPDELNRALAAVEERAGAKLARFRTTRFEPTSRAYAHAWLVSVLTDPDHFPALHDELYERAGTELATGRGNLAEERSRARSLVRRLVQALAPRALVTTTDEELAIVSEICAAEHVELEVPERARLSGIVGDAVRVCRAERARRRDR